MTEEQRGEGRLARHQPPLALAAQTLVVQRPTLALAPVAQRPRRDDGVHRRLAGEHVAAAHRLAVARDEHVQLGQQLFIFSRLESA